MPSHESSQASPHVRWVTSASRKAVTERRRELPINRAPADPDKAVNPLAYRFGQTVRARRRELNLAQREMGDRVGLVRTTLANIEAGRSSPTVAQLVTFATALNMDPLELLRRTLEGVPS